MNRVSYRGAESAFEPEFDHRAVDNGVHFQIVCPQRVIHLFPGCALYTWGAADVYQHNNRHEKLEKAELIQTAYTAGYHKLHHVSRTPVYHLNFFG